MHSGRLMSRVFVRGGCGYRFIHCTSLCLGTVIPYKLADIGEGIREVQVLSVFVKPGDTIMEFDKICEVQSDKATVDITSRYNGTIHHVHIQKGATALVGESLVDIDVADEEGDAAAGEAPPSAPSTELPNSSMTTERAPRGKVLCTPATRYLAKEKGIDLALVEATGKGGRVTKDDLIKYANGSSREVASGAVTPRPTPSATAAMPSGGATFGDIVTEAGDEVVPITGVRLGMVKSMTRAASIPTFSFSDEYEVTKLMNLRKALIPSVARRSADLKLSFMPFFMKAASMALREFPDINAYCPHDCSVIVRKSSHNIGFAMDTPNGLIVPVVKNVQLMSILDLAKAMHVLVERGRLNRLTTDDMTGGTFTLSNIGTIGATSARPVILPPQVAIGAIGRLQQLPRFNDSGDLIKANIITVSFSADHRIIDGATMVRFSNVYRRFIENPEEMLLDLH